MFHQKCIIFAIISICLGWIVFHVKIYTDTQLPVWWQWWCAELKWVRAWVKAPKSQNQMDEDEQFIKLPEVELTNHEKYRY